MARRSIIPIFIPHMGCPNRCIFCDQHAIAAQREPSPDDVTNAIASVLERCGTPAEVAFYGGSFTAIHADKQTAYLQAVQPFIEMGTVCGIRLSTHPACVDDASLERLKRYGVRTVELGAQSMDDDVLRRAGRGHTSDDTRTASHMVKAHGFELVLQMMVGLPGEASPMHTARQLLALNPNAVRIYPVVVVRGTELERMWRLREYTPLTPEQAAELCAQPFELFYNAAVPVIRMGLNPTDELAGEVVAGAYHPALGEMVRSEILLRRARALLADTSEVNITIAVAHGKTSQMRGQNSANIKKLTAEFNLQSVNIIEDVDLDGFDIKLM